MRKRRTPADVQRMIAETERRNAARTTEQVAEDDRNHLIITLGMEWITNQGGGLTLRQFVELIEIKHGPSIANEWLEDYRARQQFEERNPTESFEE